MGGEPLNETFSVEDGYLVRRVVPARGEPYQHRCPLAAYEAVAHAADAQGASGITLGSLQEATGLPGTQVAVALGFMKERGCLVPVFGRRHKASSTFVFEDAMTEYHALSEKPADA